MLDIKIVTGNLDERILGDAWEECDDVWIKTLEKTGISNVHFIETPVKYGSVQFLVDFFVGPMKFYRCRLCQSCDRSWYLEPAQLEKEQVYPDDGRPVHQMADKLDSSVERGYLTVCGWPPKFWCMVEDAIIGKMLEMVRDGDLVIHEIDFNKMTDPGRHIYERMVNTDQLPGRDSLIGSVPEYAMEGRNS